MNSERILQLADVIEKTPHAHSYDGYGRSPLSDFNMDSWHCGTVGCIGGWTCQLFKTTNAQACLGLDDAVADPLFYPWQSVDRAVWEEITPSQAASCLRHLAATGEVDWPRALSVGAEG